MNNNYLTYSPADLAQDDQFIHWVQSGMPSNSAWSTWLQNNSEVAAKVKEAITIVSSFQYSEKNIPLKQTDDLWARINDTLAEEESTKVVSMPRRNLLRLVAYAAAACVALFFVSRLLIDSNENIYVGNGETLAHILPDASKVQLNAQSSLKYNKDSWGAQRMLSLDGEAYFDVEKGQTFIVETAFGEVTVLGTSFNIYSRADGFQVHCTSGRVQVISGNEKVILNPDSRSSLINGKLIKEELKEGKDIAWLNKTYRFNATPLKVVFESIQRQFDVQVIVDDTITDRLYTGTYEATDLTEALHNICFPMELSSTIQGKEIRIKADVDK